MVGEVLGALDDAGAANDTLVIVASDNGRPPRAASPRRSPAGTTRAAASADTRPTSSMAATACHSSSAGPAWYRRHDLEPPRRHDGPAGHRRRDRGDASALRRGRGQPELRGRDPRPRARAASRRGARHALGLRRVRDPAGTVEAPAGPRLRGMAPLPRPGSPGEKGLPMLLYDLEADPRESKNLVASHPEIVARLEGLLAAYRAFGRSVPAPGDRSCFRPGEGCLLTSLAGAAPAAPGDQAPGLLASSRTPAAAGRGPRSGARARPRTPSPRSRGCGGGSASGRGSTRPSPPAPPARGA